MNFFVVSGAKNTRKTYRLLEYERETYASFFKVQRVRNTTDTHYEYERETYRRWRLYEAIFVESNFNEWFGGKRQFLENTDKREFCDHSCVHAHIFYVSL